MKKILLMNVVLTTFAAFAGTVEVDVPKKVLYEFRKQFGLKATVHWEKMDDVESVKDLFVAHFIKDGIWSEAYFEESGEFVGIGKNITQDHLPAKIQGLQQNKFKGYNVMEVYEYYLKDSEIPVYGLTITNKQRMVFLKIDETGFLSVVKREKFKN